MENDTQDRIKVSSDRDTRRLNPGESKKLYRWEDFTITVESEFDSKQISTRSHVISIDNGDPIEYRTFNR